MIRLDIRSSMPLAREDELDFVVPMQVDMLCPGEFDEVSTFSVRTDSEEKLIVESPSDSDIEAGSALSIPAGEAESEYLVGRLWAERLDWSYAEECGYPVLSICDARSGTWLQVLETLTRNDGTTFRKGLHLEHFITDVVFIHELLIHPEIKDRVAILAASLQGISTDNSLVLMYHEQSETHHLEDWECNQLGFKKIARSNLLLRDNHFRVPFSETHVAGRHVPFTATAEHENWIVEQWHELIADHPSS